MSKVSTRQIKSWSSRIRCLRGKLKLSLNGLIYFSTLSVLISLVFCLVAQEDLSCSLSLSLSFSLLLSLSLSFSIAFSLSFSLSPFLCAQILKISALSLSSFFILFFHYSSFVRMREERFSTSLILFFNFSPFSSTPLQPHLFFYSFFSFLSQAFLCKSFL